MEFKVAIIDGDSIIYHAFHPNKKLDDNNIPIRENNKFVYEDKTEDEIKASTDYLLNKILKDCGATHYILFVKGKGNFRDVYNNNYKADRKTEPPKFWNFTKQYFIDKWEAVETKGIESDDAVNITRLNIPNSFICAIDSDLLALEGTHFNWKKNEWIITSKYQSIYNFWKLMICGTHNNTKGIPKKGEVYAENKLSKQFDEQFGIDYNQFCRDRVLYDYIKHFGEYEGIKEYFTNYISIKVLEKLDGFEIPKPVEYINNNKDLWERVEENNV